jgi:mono/diheme cytochrome c family protein
MFCDKLLNIHWQGITFERIPFTNKMINEPRKQLFFCRNCCLFALVLFFLCTVASVLAENNSIEEGKGLFNAKCAPCHTIGGGKKVGPDLEGITKTRQKEWLAEFISDPEKMFSSNDPTAVALLKEYKIKMPVLGLSNEDVSAVLDFLGSRKSVVEPSAPARGTPSGDAGAGKRLFTGAAAFRNGGAPCIACHNVNRIGYLGGGNLGPDLTHVYSALGDGIVLALTNIPFPSMVPVFKEHPLSPEEARDLAAFFKGIAASKPQNFTPRVLIIALIGFIVLMFVIWLAWRHRLLPVREEMAESSRSRGKAR